MKKKKAKDERNQQREKLFLFLNKIPFDKTLRKEKFREREREKQK